MTWKALLHEAFTDKGTWIWTIVQTGVVGLSAWFVVRQLRLQRIATMATTLQALDKRWRSHDMLTARRGACAYFGSGEAHINRPEEAICGFFEEIGMYVRKGVLPLDVVWDTYSQSIEHYWAIFTTHVHKMRQDLGDKTFYDQFERLNGQLRWHGRCRRLRHFQFRDPAINLDSFVQAEQQAITYYEQFLPDDDEESPTPGNA